MAADAAKKLVQALPRSVLRDFDRERPEICGARAPSFFVWFFFRLCRSSLAFDASLFVNCCEFHHGDSMRCPPWLTWGFAEQFQRSDGFVGIPMGGAQKKPRQRERGLVGPDCLMRAFRREAKSSAAAANSTPSRTFGCTARRGRRSHEKAPQRRKRAGLSSMRAAGTATHTETLPQKQLHRTGETRAAGNKPRNQIFVWASSRLFSFRPSASLHPIAPCKTDYRHGASTAHGRIIAHGCTARADQRGMRAASRSACAPVRAKHRHGSQG